MPLAVHAQPALAAPTYKPPAWQAPAGERSKLEGLVKDALPRFNVVAVSQTSADDLEHHIVDDFSLRDSYRRGLEAYGEIAPGQSLNHAVYASIELEPKHAATWVQGVQRYGDLSLRWKPSVLAHARISPIISGTYADTQHYGHGLKAGGIGDIASILTDTLLAQHGAVPEISFGTAALTHALSLPHDQAVDAVAKLLTAPPMHQLSPETLLTNITPDAIAGITFLTGDKLPPGSVVQASSPAALKAVHTWAAQHHVPTQTEPSGPAAS